MKKTWNHYETVVCYQKNGKVYVGKDRNKRMATMEAFMLMLGDI